MKGWRRMLTVTLPWPDRRLSPNARCHWAAKARVAQAAHLEAWALARERRNGPLPAEGPIRVALVFHPPTRARRDLDNFQAACKWALDGIAQALDVDDSRFRPVSDWGEPIRGGQVVVTIGD
jgi:crossover junction endodeoxyribonuclease RusA